MPAEDEMFVMVMFGIAIMTVIVLILFVLAQNRVRKAVAHLQVMNKGESISIPELATQFKCNPSNLKRHTEMAIEQGILVAFIEDNIVYIGTAKDHTSGALSDTMKIQTGTKMNKDSIVVGIIFFAMGFLIIFFIPELFFLGIIADVIGTVLVLVGIFSKKPVYTRIPVSTNKENKNEQRYCVKCGRSIPFDANLCPYCGHDYR